MWINIYSINSPTNFELIIKVTVIANVYKSSKILGATTKFRAPERRAKSSAVLRIRKYQAPHWNMFTRSCNLVTGVLWTADQHTACGIIHFPKCALKAIGFRYNTTGNRASTTQHLHAYRKFQHGWVFDSSNLPRPGGQRSAISRTHRQLQVLFSSVVE